MEAPKGVEAPVGSSRATIGKVAAGLFEMDMESLDWDMSFIQLGGDSILAIDFIVRCRDAELWVDMVDLLTANSLNELVQAIDQENDATAGDQETHVQEENVAEPSSKNAHRAQRMNLLLRFASMEVPEGTEATAVRLALERFNARYSALRSSWSISSDGKYTLTTTAASSSQKPHPFHATTASETTPIKDVLEMLKQDMLSDAGPALRCCLLLNATLKGHFTIVLAADANVVDALSMRLIVRELRASLYTNLSESTHALQFCDWVAAGYQYTALESQHVAGSYRLAPKQLQQQNKAHIESAMAFRGSFMPAATDPDLKELDNAAVTFQLPHSTAKKLFEPQTHAALRTNPVDIINAALARAMGSYYQNKGIALVLKSLYSVREEQNLPPDSVGAYEAKVEWETPIFEPQQDLIEAVRLVCDARASSPRSRDEKPATKVLVDCTRLHAIVEDDEMAAPTWYSDPNIGDVPCVSVATIGNQVVVSMQLLDETLPQQFLIREFELYLDETVNQLAQAPEMAVLRDFPLIKWPYSALDDLMKDLKARDLAISDIESIGPSSAVQESFFVSQAINPGSYISHATIRLAPADADTHHVLDTEQVIFAWANIVKRHAILRTSFVESRQRPGKYDQLVLKPAAVQPRVAVFPGSPTNSNVAAFATDKFQVPMRLSVYEVSARELQLELDISHALVDGHSAKILLHDLRASYLRDSYFSELAPLSYTDFAFHQQKVLEAGQTSAGVAYWTSYLTKASESHLPLVTTNPRLTGLETAHCTISLASGKLRAICGKLSITPANLFHIAWALALRRIILSDAITFSYIVSGRNGGLDNSEATVGPFINTLPFSLELSSELSVADALESSKKDWQQGSLFHDIPISELEVSKTRSLKRLGNTLLSIEREGSSSHPFADGTDLSLSARTSATDVSALYLLLNVVTD